MSEPTRNPTVPRARAVADLPVEGLIARAPELAREWAMALVAQMPPARIGEIPLEQIAQRGPSLCAQALRALASEPDLSQLTGRGDSRGREREAGARDLAEISGARDGADAALAAEALRGVLWESLLHELGPVSAREMGDVADRLAHVCALALAATLEREKDAPPAPGASRPLRPPVIGLTPDVPARTAAVIVDELEPAPEAAVPPGAGEPAEIEIEIRDQRARPGPSAWIATIGRRLEDFHQDARPFSVLLVEPLQPAMAHELAGAGDLSERIERSLEAELAGRTRERSGAAEEVLTREAPGRWWVLSSETDRAGAEALAQRLTRAAAAITDRLGEPVELAVGTAVCPTDGREPSALAAHADVGLYAARSSARAAGRHIATSTEGL